MTHQPDLAKIPEQLRPLPWQTRTDNEEWYDGMVLLVAVAVCLRGGMRCLKREADRWEYEFSVVTIYCDEHYCCCTVDGEPWGWQLSDMDFYVVVRG